MNIDTELEKILPREKIAIHTPDGKVKEIDVRNAKIGIIKSLIRTITEDVVKEVQVRRPAQISREDEYYYDGYESALDEITDRLDTLLGGK